jgi:hypothetical protein
MSDGPEKVCANRQQRDANAQMQQVCKLFHATFHIMTGEAIG